MQALAVAAALRPVTRLAKEVRERGADDIAPISTQELPSDLRPLVMAVNRQIETGLVKTDRGLVWFVAIAITIVSAALIVYMIVAPGAQ